MLGCRGLQLWAMLVRLPDTSEQFESLESQDAVDLFVDGSCRLPDSPPLRLATCSVTVARHCRADPVVVLNAGLLPGVLQTSFRAEIQGLLAACRYCRASGAHVRVGCDCLGVVRKARALLAGTWFVKPSTKNCDLWMLVSDEISLLAVRLDVQKVSAHVADAEEH